MSRGRAKEPPRPAPPPIAGNPDGLRGTLPNSAPTCYVCQKPHPVMLTVEVKDGERTVCSPCWRRDYRC